MRRRLAVILGLGVLIASASALGAPPGLKPFERGTWRSVLKGHEGRPTLVHFWGVTCGPCKVELPLLGRFAKDHPDIDVVTISADLVPNLPAATQSMLDKAGLSSTENFVFNDGFAERLRFEIDPTWQGEIPRTMLISPEGTITTIEGSAEIADLEKWSAQQLSKH
ncbi:TlpA family protein disulfide reductase [Bradyrhizobium guangxiense]|uniref:TlpA family protein disulfide reductase n=1 Tax=Bradyrhizobium guangxiense TaxID=1325115 RepID=UPI001008B383|nr:TlpA disulfide reductase family protein [Bradyrhizobium guangxiense]